MVLCVGEHRSVMWNICFFFFVFEWRGSIFHQQGHNIEHFKDGFGSPSPYDNSWRKSLVHRTQGKMRTTPQKRPQLPSHSVHWTKPNIWEEQPSHNTNSNHRWNVDGSLHFQASVKSMNSDLAPRESWIHSCEVSATCKEKRTCHRPRLSQVKGSLLTIHNERE